MSQMVVLVRLSSPVGEAGWKVFEIQKPVGLSLPLWIIPLSACTLFIANNNLNRFIGNLDVSRNKVRYLTMDIMVYSIWYFYNKRNFNSFFTIDVFKYS